MEKVDFKKQLKHLYSPSAKDFEIIDVPAMQFLMVDGEGDPNTARGYQEALEALYAAAYTLKFMSKVDPGRDYTVPPLEGLWWADDMNVFATGDKNAWKWTAMIMTPDWISHEAFGRAVEQLRKKKDPPALDLVRLESYDEGRSVQILHIGSYDQEEPTIRRLHEEFLPVHGLVENGKHHEIYLSDPRRVAPEKLRTVLRQPVRGG